MSASRIIANRFEIRGDLLGRGGMGDVYRGIDTQTGQVVAVKARKPEVVAGRPDMLARFVRKGRALRQQDHPNIVKMVDAVEGDGRHYLVMEYVEGGFDQAEATLQSANWLERVFHIDRRVVAVVTALVVLLVVTVAVLLLARSDEGRMGCPTGGPMDEAKFGRVGPVHDADEARQIGGQVNGDQSIKGDDKLVGALNLMMSSSGAVRFSQLSDGAMAFARFVLGVVYLRSDIKGGACRQAITMFTRGIKDLEEDQILEVTPTPTPTPTSAPAPTPIRLSTYTPEPPLGTPTPTYTPSPAWTVPPLPSTPIWTVPPLPSTPIWTVPPLPSTPTWTVPPLLSTPTP